ncbi:MAG: exonuclease SbcCD subunit D [Streptococcaceae bacterium]|jgi:exonuclease SbcD|nr:exonuclease SbcCD subunit D [Streptococcaceae bacterium]
MKLLHTADWHIGRTLNGHSLMQEQQYVFEQLLKIAQKEKVDGIIIAGDLYDRSIPGVDAVSVLNEMLKKMNIVAKLPIYAISGNHDGAKRLHYGREWLQFHDLHLHTLLEDAFTPVETPEAQIFLLPFFDPMDARVYYAAKGMDEEKVKGIKTIHQAMKLVIKDFELQFNPAKKQILVTHFAVTKNEGEQIDLTSETTSKVGGLASIPSNLFEAFDYVALGHIHTHLASPQKNIQYAGSLTKFSIKEARKQMKKGVFIVEIGDEITSIFHAIAPYKDILVLEETWETLINPEFYGQYQGKQTGFAIVIKEFDRASLAGQNIRGKLQEIYGTVYDLAYEDLKQTNALSKVAQVDEEMSNEEIVSMFYQQATDEELSEIQNDLIEDIFIKLGKEKA